MSFTLTKHIGGVQVLGDVFYSPHSGRLSGVILYRTGFGNFVGSQFISADDKEQMKTKAAEVMDRATPDLLAAIKTVKTNRGSK